MTELLEQAIAKIKNLPDSEQDTIAAIILEELKEETNYSARISRDYRAVGQLDRDTVIWFWIGSHTDYDKLLSGI